jgi:hypothetical protein
VLRIEVLRIGALRIEVIPRHAQWTSLNSDYYHQLLAEPRRGPKRRAHPEASRCRWPQNRRERIRHVHPRLRVRHSGSGHRDLGSIQSQPLHFPDLEN